MVIYDRDVRFTSKFWKYLFAGLETKINFSTSYHPETNGQIERTNQFIEDMLRMYVMEKPTKWEDYLHLVEFAYNNGYQASTNMNPLEIMYGKKCTTPLTCDSPMDRLIIGPEMLKDMQQTIREVQMNLKVA